MMERPEKNQKKKEASQSLPDYGYLPRCTYMYIGTLYKHIMIRRRCKQVRDRHHM